MQIYSQTDYDYFGGGVIVGQRLLHVIVYSLKEEEYLGCAVFVSSAWIHVLHS